MGKWKLKFPCGLQVEGHNVGWYFGNQEIDQLYDCGCPIHGKKCQGRGL